MPPNGRARRSRRSSRKAPASCPSERARRSRRVIRESVEERLREVESGRRARGRVRARRVRPADRSRCSASARRAAALEAAYRADRQGPAREGQRGLCPPRLAADGFDELGRDRRRQDPVRRSRRQGVGRLPQGQSRGLHPPRGAAARRQREPRAIRAHYEADPEFQQSVNRYVHDFEAMLRRVLAERDGGMIAVTLMSSRHGQALRRARAGDRHAGARTRCVSCRNRGRRA